MISPSELMIGNIVNFHFLTTSFNAPIIEIGKNDVTVKDGDHENKYSFNNISPIFITKDILESCGFKVMSEGYWMINIPGAESTFFYNLPSNKIINYNHYVKIHSLHWLQNFIHIVTRERLKINL